MTTTQPVPPRPYAIDRNLTNHPPTDKVATEMEEVRRAAKNLARAIDTYCPEGREKSLAFTNLEQTVFWSMASLAREGH